MDLHLIELTAHLLLSGSLDTLNDNFELLGKSQVILLTRLNLIEQHLRDFEAQVDSEGTVTDKDVEQYTARVKAHRKRLQATMKTIAKIEKRLDKVGLPETNGQVPH